MSPARIDPRFGRLGEYSICFRRSITLYYGQERTGSIQVYMRSVALVFVLVAAAGAAWGGNAAAAGKLTEELPTIKCLGFRWLVGGDDNHNARVHVEYRKAGSRRWRRALDLFGVESEGMRKGSRPPAGQRLFAGSIFDLAGGTRYKVKLSLEDPDGGSAVRTVRTTTWTAPKRPVDGRKINVRPGGLKAALKSAKPGDTLVLGKGVYKGTFSLRSGEPGKPIVLVGSSDGPAVLDGGGAGNVIYASGVHDVMLEGLAFQNARWALAFNGGARISVTRCVLRDCDHGFVAQRNSDKQRRIYIADNVFVGRSKWPRTKGIESRRGIQVSGTGHVICYNRISRFGDGIDTFSNYPCAAIDIYGNEISECTDDGIEMDYSEHNTRCFDNRLTNVFQGISIQPIHGGPVYVFRNAMYNVTAETFKMHNNPSGGIFYHNTSVKTGMPLVLWTHETVSNCITRNNLFVGTKGNYAYESTAPMRRCDFDYDGFGGTWKQFLKFNRVRYKTIAAARKNAPAYRNAVRVHPATLFASGIKPPGDTKTKFDVRVNDLRIKAGSAAIDAGVALDNINDGFKGKAPDLGAYELGAKLPHYGPRR